MIHGCHQDRDGLVRDAGPVTLPPPRHYGNSSKESQEPKNPASTEGGQRARLDEVRQRGTNRVLFSANHKVPLFQIAAAYQETSRLSNPSKPSNLMRMVPARSRKPPRSRIRGRERRGGVGEGREGWERGEGGGRGRGGEGGVGEGEGEKK